MTGRFRQSLGKIGYGTLFVAGVPLVLFLWARQTESAVGLPAVRSTPGGVALTFVGLVFVASGMLSLWVLGKGLPMNAYPPKRYVTGGIYRLTPHPIYVGFSILCVGASVIAGSASGLWLVSPMVILGCTAIVEGYEKHDLQKRFPDARSQAVIGLAAEAPNPPALTERLSVYVLVFLSWLILYGAAWKIGPPPDAIASFLPNEKNLPVVEWTEAFYASVYPFVVLAPLAAGSRRILRQFASSGLVATAVIVLLYLTVPLIAPPRPFTPHSWLGRILEHEREWDTPAAAFPSFHVVWAMLAARVYADRWRSLRWLAWVWAGAITVSCITTGMHTLVDVAGGLLFGGLIIRIGSVWEALRKGSEAIANSWREWRFGPLRFIVHGLYGGLGAFLGILAVCTFAGPGSLPFALLVSVAVLVSAAIWAQVVEGSPSLLRPYGWYGGVIGAVVGIMISGLLGASPWLLSAAFSVAAPWIQSAGRLRCLVQGCCHGRAVSERIGIRYTHPRSRVCRLSDLGGVPVHPTPLYSILWNAVIALIVTRLWIVHAELSIIAGVYLLLMGLGRFVEESYRGEPQTPVRGGLRLYQWMAVLSVAAGILITMIRGTGSAPAPQWDASVLVGALAFGVLTTLALGADFPESNRRFARLA